jgi:predicted ArsR family transcriptional regulator
MRLVFTFLLRTPMTQDQLRAETGLGDNAAKRCSDLKNCGWIKDSGARAPSNKGKPAALWQPTEYGRTAFAGGKEPEPRKGVEVDLII